MELSEPSGNYQRFTDLQVWKEARIFRNAVADVVNAFPSEERYRLVDQIIRASRSIGDNISEGHGRYTFKDQINFCIISRGSLSETLNHLYTALDNGFITDLDFKALESQYTKLEKLLNGYISFLRNKLNESR